MLIPAVPGHAIQLAAPTFVIDHTSPFACFPLIALLSSPLNLEQQRHMIVTYGHLLRAFLNRPGERAILGAEFNRAIQEAATELGVRTDAVLSMPLARLIAEHVIREVSNAPGRIEDELIVPGGGDQGIADAPGSKALTQIADRAWNGPVRNTGYLLLLVARMQRNHPDSRPSLNRALAVMEATCTGPDWGGTGASTLFEQWKEWQSVAPLSAAIWAWVQRRPAGVPKEDWHLSALRPGEGLKNVIQWTRWMRHFAVTFKPKGGQKTLLDDLQTVDFRSTLPPALPHLFPLSTNELQAASSYHARTQKGR